VGERNVHGHISTLTSAKFVIFFRECVELGVGCGEGVPFPTREGSPENFLVFDLKMLNFGVF